MTAATPISATPSFGRGLYLNTSFADNDLFEAGENTSVVRINPVPGHFSQHVTGMGYASIWSGYEGRLHQQHAFSFPSGASDRVPGARAVSEAAFDSAHAELSVSTIPDPIRANWDALRHSGLSEECFNTIVTTAINRGPTQPSGLGPIETDSLRSFLEFWSHIKAFAAEPEISFNPKGLVQAEWYKNNSNFLIIEFRENGTLFFSLWDNALPIEGIQHKKRKRELADMFRVRRIDPLQWCG